MKTKLAVACVLLVIGLGGCAWLEERLMPSEELQRIAAEKAILEGYKTALAQYEAEREYWRQMIAQLPIGDERRAEWLAKEEEAFRRALYYRDKIAALEPALLAHEQRVRAAAGPRDVLSSMVTFAEETTPPPYRPLVSLLGGLVLLLWGIHERRKRAAVTSALRATATGIDAAEPDLGDVAVEALHARLTAAQEAAGVRGIVQAVRGKA